ncbi:hypothetical protein WA026_023456 [Henosepilachna vigintioctopunctata]|uniref:Uncharacterized protein n=1 Tax=Henosepilachna vigintioctopunctata TaxID=420089 RepID=A0AAW1VCD9_9CUCU
MTLTSKNTIICQVSFEKHSKLGDMLHSRLPNKLYGTFKSDLIPSSNYKYRSSGMINCTSCYMPGGMLFEETGDKACFENPGGIA